MASTSRRAVRPSGLASGPSLPFPSWKNCPAGAFSRSPPPRQAPRPPVPRGPRSTGPSPPIRPRRKAWSPSRRSARCASGVAAESATYATASSGSSKATPRTRSRKGGCVRAARGRWARTADPDRLRTPLIRTGERGKEQWKAVTYEEAIAVIAERMGKLKAAHGPESLALFNHGYGQRFFQHVLKSWGVIQRRRPVVRAVPRTARHRLHAHAGQRRRLARAHRHREHRLPRPHRQPPGREHAQHPGAGVRAGHRAQHPDHRRRSALLGRGLQGEVLATDQARHRSRAPARVDERAGDRKPVRQGVRREVRHRLRQVRCRDRAVHPGVGRSGNGHHRRHDPHDRPRVLEPPAGGHRPPGAARELVRRRHPALARGRAALRAARQLVPQGRVLPVHEHEGRALPAAEVSEVGPAAGGQPRRRALPVRRRRHHDRPARRHAHRQAVSDQGLVRVLVEPPTRCRTPRRR